MSSIPRIKKSASLLFAAVALTGCGGPDLTPKQQATATAWMNWVPEWGLKDVDGDGGASYAEQVRPLAREAAECLAADYSAGLRDKKGGYQDQLTNKVRVVLRVSSNKNHGTDALVLQPTDPKFVSVFEECTGRKFSEDFAADKQPGYKPAN